MCGRGHAWQGCVCGRGVCMAGRACMAGGYASWGTCMAGGACVAGETATAVDSMHPTGMHSCFDESWQNLAL